MFPAHLKSVGHFFNLGVAQLEKLFSYLNENMLCVCVCVCVCGGGGGGVGGRGCRHTLQ